MYALYVYIKCVTTYKTKIEYTDEMDEMDEMEVRFGGARKIDMSKSGNKKKGKKKKE